MECEICKDSDDELEDEICSSCEYQINKLIDARINYGHLNEHIDGRVEACMKKARAEKTEQFWMAYI